ncbi:hypothetical protein SADUNF_Sadunf10G0108400 [Salix dunnii]|uniref:Uncharacterized protein n=1 Tax=Salix dunnii TaxID=1413687 RepID=A0A835MQS1_9ROSI|nr:hypothetical protein SADUNF_Sadunf10G0108400 [Salix dunnii]
MSSKKEEKSQAAAERIKAAALSAAKGLSRAQAERAAAAAARNVNAYGQKEEGPSRWQEKREAKRQMYLMSTEKAVRLGERKDLNSMSKGFGGNAQCQKCFQSGHWTYECKNERVYMSRPSRTQQLKNPKLRPKVSISYDLENPEGEDNPGQKREKKSKRKHRSDSDSGSTSEASVFETDSESSSVTGSESSEEESSSGNEQRVLSGVFGSRNMRFTQTVLGSSFGDHIMIWCQCDVVRNMICELWHAIRSPVKWLFVECAFAVLKFDLLLRPEAIYKFLKQLAYIAFLSSGGAAFLCPENFGRELARISAGRCKNKMEEPFKALMLDCFLLLELYSPPKKRIKLVDIQIESYAFRTCCWNSFELIWRTS